MTHKSIVKALTDLNAQGWILEGDQIENIVWTTDDVKTKAQIEAAIANPLPEIPLSVDKKLASVGLSVEDLKAALGV